jgi:hypothetical protein
LSEVLLEPNDPRVLDEVLKRIRTMTSEEWLERMRSYPDFDPAWLEVPVAPAAAGPRRVSVRRKGARSRVLARNGAHPVPSGG